MKLYAVCVKGKPVIAKRMYTERWMPISKIAHLPVGERDNFAYAPAVYTNRKEAEKMAKIVTAKYPGNVYVIVHFDSNAVEIPNG